MHLIMAGNLKAVHVDIHVGWIYLNGINHESWLNGHLCLIPVTKYFDTWLFHGAFCFNYSKFERYLQNFAVRKPSNVDRSNHAVSLSTELVLVMVFVCNHTLSGFFSNILISLCLFSSRDKIETAFKYVVGRKSRSIFSIISLGGIGSDLHGIPVGLALGSTFAVLSCWTSSVGNAAISFSV